MMIMRSLIYQIQMHLILLRLMKSVKKKFKDKRFAAGCSRDVIRTGAERLGWELDRLFEQTILAMRSCEASVEREMEALGLQG